MTTQGGFRGVTTGNAPGQGNTTSSTAASTAANHARMQQNDIAELTGYVSGLGLDTNAKNIKNLIHKAGMGLWDSSALLLVLKNTPEFHKQFPGIMRKDGSLIMDPGAYNTRAEQFARAASQVNINLTPKQLAPIVTGNQNIETFTQKVQAVASYEANSDTMSAFKAEAKAATGRNWTIKDLLKWIQGVPNKGKTMKLYDVYNSWQTRMAAQNTGFNIGVGTDDYGITHQQLLNIKNAEVNTAGQGNFQQDEGQKFAKLAQDFKTAFPESQIQGFDLSKDDLIQLEFGGPKQAMIADQVNQIMQNADFRVKAAAQDQAQNIGRRAQNVGGSF